MGPILGNVLAEEPQWTSSARLPRNLGRLQKSRLWTTASQLWRALLAPHLQRSPYTYIAENCCFRQQ